MIFKQPLFLYAAPLASAALVGLGLWGRRRREAYYFAPAKLLQTAAKGGAGRRARSILTLVLPAVLMALVMAALAQPVEQTRVMRKAVVGVLVVDVSGSMECRDMGVGRSRIEAVKDAVRDLVTSLRPGMFRIGVIAFSGLPYPVCPLTSDPQQIVSSVERLGTVWSGTNIGDALDAAVTWLKGAQVEACFIVLITDGGWNVGADPIVVASRIHEEMPRLRVYTIGIGTTGGIVRGRSIEPPDMMLLSAIAERTGGRVYSANTYHELKGVLTEEIPADMGVWDVDERNLYYFFLAPVPALLAAYLLLVEWRFKVLP